MKQLVRVFHLPDNFLNYFNVFFTLEIGAKFLLSDAVAGF